MLEAAAEHSSPVGEGGKQTYCLVESPCNSSRSNSRKTWIPMKTKTKTAGQVDNDYNNGSLVAEKRLCSSANVKDLVTSKSVDESLKKDKGSKRRPWRLMKARRNNGVLTKQMSDLV